jgi:hypothetical protein
MRNRAAIATVHPEDAELHPVGVEHWNVFAAIFHEFGCIHRCFSSMVGDYAQA